MTNLTTLLAGPPLRVLAVSPHLDDAVLSIGGTLAELAAAGHDVVVHTAFAGVASAPWSPIALEFHELWKLEDDPVTIRHGEDAAALAALGATGEFGDQLDAIYRRDEAGEWVIRRRNASGSTARPAAEPAVEAGLRAGIRASLHRARPDLVLTAAAIGAHIDHIMARDAALLESQAAGIPALAWEDLPYGTVGATVPDLPSGVALGDFVAHPVPGASWARKLAAIAHYGSQLLMLEHEGVDVVTRVDRVGHERGAGDTAERFWPVLDSDITNM